MQQETVLQRVRLARHEHAALPAHIAARPSSARPVALGCARMNALKSRRSSLITTAALTAMSTTLRTRSTEK
jgi:hypothetical protein